MPRDPQDQTVSVIVPAELATAFGFEDTFANLFIANMRVRLEADTRELDDVLINGTPGGVTPRGFLEAGKPRAGMIDLDRVRRELAARLMRSARRWSNN